MKTILCHNFFTPALSTNSGSLDRNLAGQIIIIIYHDNRYLTPAFGGQYYPANIVKAAGFSSLDPNVELFSADPFVYLTSSWSRGRYVHHILI